MWKFWHNISSKSKNSSKNAITQMRRNYLRQQYSDETGSVSTVSSEIQFKDEAPRKISLPIEMPINTMSLLKKKEKKMVAECGTQTTNFDDDSFGLKQSKNNTEDGNGNFESDEKIDDIDTDDDVFEISDEKINDFKKIQSKATYRFNDKGPISTHEMRRMPPFDISLCRLCDEIVYVNGYECIHCGLLGHQTCFAHLIITCNHRHLPPKTRVFGIDLINEEQPIPEIILQCVTELDRRGYVNLKGLYLTSEMSHAQKKRIAKLCCSIENGPHLVDFSETNHKDIGQILKIFLTELSVPLILSNLDAKLLQIAKKWPCTSPLYTYDNQKTLVLHLRLIVNRLPKQHFEVLSYLMSHFKRIADNEKETRMTATILSIIFTPILMKTIDVSVKSRVNSLLRTRAIELLITLSDDVFVETIETPSSKK